MRCEDTIKENPVFRLLAVGFLQFGFAVYFAEAVVRGFKLGLLTSSDYNNLSQCESLDDIKLYLVSFFHYCKIVDLVAGFFQALKTFPLSLSLDRHGLWILRCQ